MEEHRNVVVRWVDFTICHGWSCMPGKVSLSAPVELSENIVQGKLWSFRDLKVIAHRLIFYVAYHRTQYDIAVTIKCQLVSTDAVAVRKEDKKIQ